MNSLSWMIYLADVANGVGNFLAVLLGCSLLCFFGGLIAGGMTAGGPSFRSYHDEDDRASLTRLYSWWQGLARRTIRLAPWVFVGAFTLQTILPSANTIYAIAASELGETALSSETGNKAVQALNAWLDRQIGGNPEETE